MIKIYSTKSARETILKRTLVGETEVQERIKEKNKQLFGKPFSPLDVVKFLLSDVRNRGDLALKEWTEKLDGAKVDYFEVQSEEFEEALEQIGGEITSALELMRDRIFSFFAKQKIDSWLTSDLGGQMGLMVKPIQKVGVYIPGGTAPLPSSVLMSLIPAIVAKTKEIIVVSPPSKEGILDSTIIAACKLLMNYGTDIRLFKIGGAQAIGALTFGTKQIPSVDKIVGPGNIFVSLAKKEVFGIVGVDGIAGPTEAMIIADESANPSIVAADLLAQAEHDFLAIPILLTSDSNLAKEVRNEVKRQLNSLSRKDIAIFSLENQGGIVVTESLEEAIELSNEFAPEHLSLIIENPWGIIPKVTNAGGIFIGEYSCEVLGDYIAGSSHVMPTGGSARFASPLTVQDFVKYINIVGLDRETSLELVKPTQIIALKETLTAHANAVVIRQKLDEELQIAKKTSRSLKIEQTSIH